MSSEDVNQMNYALAGLTQRELSVMFNKSPGTVAKQLGDVKPCGRRNGKFIYQIADAAPYLCRPKNAREIAAFMRTARPNDVPSVMTKEFWNGQRSRQAFMLAEGDLWPTDKIIELLSTTFTKLRMGLLLLPDDIERSNFLTDAQVETLRNKVDGILATLAKSLVETFSPDDGEFAIQPGSYHDKTELAGIQRQFAVGEQEDTEEIEEPSADDVFGGLFDDDTDEFHGL